jgi:hypothetical protein
MKQIIDRAIKLLEEGWTKRAFARDDKNVPCMPDSSKAVCWCLGGAIIRAGCDNRVESVEDVFERIRNILSKEHATHSIIRFNDVIAQNKEEVIGLLRRV